MKNNNIKNYLEQIKSAGKLDLDYVDCLIKGLEDKHDGIYIAQNIIEIIKKRYDENQKNNA